MFNKKYHFSTLCLSFFDYFCRDLQTRHCNLMTLW
ncbi:hypothetical protein TFKS16_2484 [Tannerella forsythia KS16]|nr:hypothetical protein TF3313_2408 [Tannerella forsythia 3313]BAR52670.1 hypothetical protein TFKS16_2484 [Tannerella forsythia KS16]